jgi:hypothetical protein
MLSRSATDKRASEHFVIGSNTYQLSRVHITGKRKPVRLQRDVASLSAHREECQRRRLAGSPQRHGVARRLEVVLDHVPESESQTGPEAVAGRVEDHASRLARGEFPDFEAHFGGEVWEAVELLWREGAGPRRLAMYFDQVVFELLVPPAESEGNWHFGEGGSARLLLLWVNSLFRRQRPNFVRLPRNDGFYGFEVQEARCYVVVRKIFFKKKKKIGRDAKYM